MSSFNSRWLGYAPAKEQSREIPKNTTDKTVKSPVPVALAPAPSSGVALPIKPATVPRLPWQLERLVSAASHDLLSAQLAGVPDLNRYVLGWAAAYLVGDRDHAQARLEDAHRVWQKERNHV